MGVLKSASSSNKRCLRSWYSHHCFASKNWSESVRSTLIWNKLLACEPQTYFSFIPKQARVNRHSDLLCGYRRLIWTATPLDFNIFSVEWENFRKSMSKLRKKRSHSKKVGNGCCNVILQFTGMLVGHTYWLRCTICSMRSWRLIYRVVNTFLFFIYLLLNRLVRWCRSDLTGGSLL